jgi:acyl-CoA thioester hydrolase
MDALRQQAGWDLDELARLPFMAWVKHLAIDFLRPVLGDQIVTLTSFVATFAGSDAHIECTMSDAAGKALARCLMVVTCVDRQTIRPREWPADSVALFVEAIEP